MWMLMCRSGPVGASSIGLVSRPDGPARTSPLHAPAPVRLLVLAVGRLRPPFADDVQHYQRMLARHARLELIEVREDEKLEKRIPERAFTVLLDAGGQEYDSVGFS